MKFSAHMWEFHQDVQDSKMIQNKNAFQYDTYRPLQCPSLGGVCAYGGSVKGGLYTAPVDRITDRC